MVGTRIALLVDTLDLDARPQFLAEIGSRSNRVAEISDLSFGMAAGDTSPSFSFSLVDAELAPHFLRWLAQGDTHSVEFEIFHTLGGKYELFARFGFGQARLAAIDYRSSEDSPHGEVRLALEPVDYFDFATWRVDPRTTELVPGPDYRWEAATAEE